MIKKIAVAASIGAILTTNGYAGAMGPLMDGAEKWTPVISISGGPAWTSNSHTQTIQLTTDTENSYVGVNETKALASGELFFGMQRPIQQLLLWQMGVALGAASNATLRGDIWEDASPDFNNFTYTYQIHHYHVDAKTKLILNRWNIVQPYVSGSVGVGFNRSESFNSVSKMMEETPALPFASS